MVLPTSATVGAPRSDEQSGNAAPWLGGYWLLIARGVWLLLFVGILAEFLVSLPGYFPTVEQLCPQTCFFTRETAQTFAYLEISVSVFAWGTLAIYGILVVVSSILAGILYWRRSHEWMVLLVAYFLVAYPISNLVVASSKNPYATPASLVLVSIPAITVFYAVFLLFPSGRFVPGWSWVLLLVWVVSITVGSIWPNTPERVSLPHLLWRRYRLPDLSLPASLDVHAAAANQVGSLWLCCVLAGQSGLLRHYPRR